MDTLFARFDAHLKERGNLATGGQMINASVVETQNQRNTYGEKHDSKAGRLHEDWAAWPAKLCQRDRGRRWNLKRGLRKQGGVREEGKRVPEQPKKPSKRGRNHPFQRHAQLQRHPEPVDRGVQVFEPKFSQSQLLQNCRAQ